MDIPNDFLANLRQNMPSSRLKPTVGIICTKRHEFDTMCQVLVAEVRASWEEQKLASKKLKERVERKMLKKLGKQDSISQDLLRASTLGQKKKKLGIVANEEVDYERLETKVRIATGETVALGDGILRRTIAFPLMTVDVFSFGKDQGPITCAMRVPLILNHCNVDALFMHGICGGTELGQVIVATESFGWDLGRKKMTGDMKVPESVAYEDIHDLSTFHCCLPPTSRAVQLVTEIASMDVFKQHSVDWTWEEINGQFKFCPQIKSKSKQIDRVESTSMMPNPMMDGLMRAFKGKGKYPFGTTYGLYGNRFEDESISGYDDVEDDNDEADNDVDGEDDDDDGNDNQNHAAIHDTPREKKAAESKHRPIAAATSSAGPSQLASPDGHGHGKNRNRNGSSLSLGPAPPSAGPLPPFECVQGIMVSVTKVRDDVHDVYNTVQQEIAHLVSTPGLKPAKPSSSSQLPSPLPVIPVGLDMEAFALLTLAVSSLSSYPVVAVVKGTSDVGLNITSAANQAILSSFRLDPSNNEDTRRKFRPVASFNAAIITFKLVDQWARNADRLHDTISRKNIEEAVRKLHRS